MHDNFIFSSISAQDKDKMEKELNLFETETERESGTECGMRAGIEKTHKKLMEF